MKKLFVILGIAFCGLTLGCSKVSYTQVKAEEEITEVGESEEIETEEENTEEAIIEEETTTEEKEDISNTAKDIREVIVAFFSQPLVIAGVTTTLGAIILSVFGKIIITIIMNKTSKYNREIEELTKTLTDLEKSLEIVENKQKVSDSAINELINGTKNIRLRKKLLSIVEQPKVEIKEVKEELEQVKVKVKVK